MKKTIAALAFALAAASLFAQDQQGGGFGPPPPGGGQGGFQGQGPRGPMGPRSPMGPGLLLRPEVVKELKLSDEQIDKIHEMMPPMPPEGGQGFGGPGGPPPGAQGGPGGPPRGQGGGPGGPPRGGGQGGPGGPPQGGGPGGPPNGGPGGPPQGPGHGGFPGGQGGPGGFGQGGPGMPPGGQQFDKQIKEILNPGQYTRFKQIELQIQGPAAFGRPDVAAKLGLTDEQMNQIRQIHESMRDQMRPPQGGGQDGPPSREQMEKHMKQMDEMRQQLLQKVLAVLTSEQRQKWQSLTGAPFKLNMRPPQGPRGE